MMAPLRGASWVPPGLARLLAVALQGTILPWMATLVLPEGGLLPALPVQPVLFPPQPTTRWRHWPHYRTGSFRPLAAKANSTIPHGQWTTDQNSHWAPQALVTHMGKLRPREGTWFTGGIRPGLSHPWGQLFPAWESRRGSGSQMPGSYLGMWPPSMGCLCTHKTSG